MNEIQSAVAAYLQEKTGVRAVEERSRAAGYPLLAVTAREDGTVVLDGGRQVEHTYALTVTAASDREREEASALLSRVAEALLRGVPFAPGDGSGDRVLHPTDIRTEGDTLTCAVSICRLLPRTVPGQTPPEVMESIHVALR